KVQVSKILPKIEQIVNKQLEAKVLTRLSNSSKTSYVVVADLSEMELKKILIEKMEGNNESATVEEPMQTTFEMEEPSHPEFETGADYQPIVVQIVLWYLDSGCSKHMTGDRSQLINFVQKFMGTVKFRNDHVAKIMGYDDYKIGNVTILRVYFVEGLGHNLFSGTVLQGLVRGLPKLKFKKDYLCSACAMGKSKKKSHKPKSEDTNQEKLYLLHMDLCGLMRVESVNKKNENLGKLQPKADIGIFIEYAPTKKAFRIYNSTRQIVETIHVDFDELMAMAFEQRSSGPALIEMTPATVSLGLMQKPSSSTPYVPPSRNDWDLLFQPMFDELLNPPPSVDPQAPEVIALIVDVIPLVQVKSTGSPSSTIVDQDAPSPSKSQTTPETQSSVIPQDVEEDIYNIEVSHMGNDPLFGVSIPEFTFAQSSSATSPHTIDALTQSCWIEAMQEELNEFERLEISQSPRGIFINQSKYALESLKKYGFESCDPVDTSMVEKSKLDEDKEEKAVDPSHYRSMIDTLLYLIASRHDLQFAICMCARYQARPTKKHVYAVKRIFRYLRVTVNQGLWYPKDSSVALTAFADADHAGCQDTHRNTSGSLQFLGERLISWSSKRQKSAAIFSRKLNTSPYLDVVLKFYGCDHNLRTMALDLTKFQCTAITKVLLPYAVIFSNTLGLSISTSDTTLSRSRCSDNLYEGILGDSHCSSSFYLVQDGQQNHIVNLESFREMLHIFPRLPHPPFVEPAFEEEIMAFLHFLRHNGVIRKLTDGLYHKRNVDFAYLMWEDFIYQVEHKDTKKSNEMYYPSEDIMNSNAYKEYYAVATGVTPPKPKASVRKTRSSSDTTITPPTTAAGLRLTTSEKGNKQLKLLKPRVYLHSLSGSGADEGTGTLPGVLDVPTDESEEEISWNSTDEEGDDDEGKDGDGDDGEEGDDDDDDDEDDDGEEGNGEEYLGREEGHDEEEDEDELYKDININLGRGIQTTQEIKDSHVTLTPVNTDGQQQSSSVSSQFVTNNDEFLKIIDENMQKIIKEQVKEQVKKMEGNKSIHRSNEQRNLYKALVDAYESDKIILDTYEDTVTLKRRRDDDADKDKEPSAGLVRRSKRHREGKEPDESATAEEPMQTTFGMEEPSHPEFKIGADDQPIVQSSQHPEWFSQQQKPLTPDRDWNKTLSATHESIQPGASSRKYTTSVTKTKASDYGHIKWIEDLVPRTMRIQEPIGYDKHALWGISHWGRKRQQFYDFTVNRESARDVYSKRRIIAVTELKIVEWHNYKHLDWIMVRRDDDKLYKFKEGDFKRLRIQDIEDMLLLLVQGKLTNLTVKERFAFNVSLRMFTRSIVIQRCMEDLQLGVKSYQKKLNLTKLDTYRSELKRKEAYIAYSNPRGFIYQNKDKQNRLMQIDELHKFSDGTLTDVRTTLDDRLKRIRMKYLPQSIWRKSDKDKAMAMIQAIDKRLKTRRIMWSLERFVGGRLYEGDFRMLQRTI
nr:uncharacterized mitochondrial protein AtMg00810-like [Tanacetum cinerariifolium]